MPRLLSDEKVTEHLDCMGWGETLISERVESLRLHIQAQAERIAALEAAVGAVVAQMDDGTCWMSMREAVEKYLYPLATKEADDAKA